MSYPSKQSSREGGLTQKFSKPQQEYKGMISEAPPRFLVRTPSKWIWN